MAHDKKQMGLTDGFKEWGGPKHDLRPPTPVSVPGSSF